MRVLVTTQEQQCAAAAGWWGGAAQPSDGSDGARRSDSAADARRNTQLGRESGSLPQLRAGKAQVSQRQQQHNSSQQLNGQAERAAEECCIGDACESTFSDADAASTALPDADRRYIVRFRDYRPAEEHRRALLQHLSPAAAQGAGTAPTDEPPWRWIARNNKAAAFPTDFGLLAISADIAAIKVQIPQHCWSGSRLAPCSVLHLPAAPGVKASLRDPDSRCFTRRTLVQPGLYMRHLMCLTRGRVLWPGYISI